MIRTVVHLPRGLGKTTDLVRMAKENGGVILVRSEAWAQHLRERFDLPDDAVMSWRVANERLRGKERRPIYIDDADALLAEYVGRSVEGVSMSVPDRVSVTEDGYRLPGGDR